MKTHSKLLIELNKEGIEIFRGILPASRERNRLIIYIHRNDRYFDCEMQLTINKNQIKAEAIYPEKITKATIENFNPLDWTFDWIEDGIHYLIR